LRADQRFSAPWNQVRGFAVDETAPLLNPVLVKLVWGSTVIFCNKLTNQNRFVIRDASKENVT
jgi:hypothetical protein